MAKNAKTYLMNGKTYNTLVELATELGRKRVRPTDFNKFGITVVAAEEQPQEEVQAQPTQKQEAAPKKAAAKKVNKETAKKAEATKPTGTKDEIAHATEIGEAGKQQEFAEYIKGFTTEALADMAGELGLKTWDDIESAPIRRMRIVMAIKGHYFPGKKTTASKPKSPWHGIDLKDMIKAAKKAKVTFRTTDDPKIQRMYLTQALNAAGVKPVEA